MNSPNHTHLEGYEGGRLLWVVYFKQSTWSWLDVEKSPKMMKITVTEKIIYLTSPPVPIWFLIIDPIPIFTLVCAHLTWLANNKYSRPIWTPCPYLQLKKARKDGQSGRPWVKQATTQKSKFNKYSQKVWKKIETPIPSLRTFFFNLIWLFE